MSDRADRSPDIVLAANLVDRLSCAVDYDSNDETLPRKHYPCLRDDLGDLHHDLLDAPNAATARVVKVVADAERAARVAEIRAIADWLDEEAHKDFLDSDQRPYAADKLRERADELEAGNG